MEINEKEAKFLLDAIAQKPVHHTLAEVLGGIKVDEVVVNLIKKLQLIIKPMNEENTEEVSEVTPEVTEVPSEPVEKTPVA